MSQGQDLRARELAQYDDIATSLCVDPGVGFTTHKMNPRFRHVKGRFGKLRGVLESYSRDGNAERAYESLVSGNWARTFLMGKPKQSITAFKKHVSGETRFSCFFPSPDENLKGLLSINLCCVQVFNFPFFSNWVTVFQNMCHFHFVHTKALQFVGRI